MGVPLNCEKNSSSCFSTIVSASYIIALISLKGPISFLLFFCLFLIEYSIFGFSFIHSIACLSFLSLFFCFVCINCFSVSQILLSICFFFSLLYALCFPC